MIKVLFQGDSITDASRWRENVKHLGCGYALMAAAEIGMAYPNKFEFRNEGIGGNKITDLYARMKRDIIQHKPDYMSLMIGVNDVWHKTLDGGDDTSDERFEQLYHMLIDDVLEALPDIKIMIMTPYCDSVTDGFFEGFNDAVCRKAQIAKRIADEYGFAFLDTQAVIDRIQKLAPLEYWTEDGVHPTVFGHKAIADEWVKTFKGMIGEN